MQGVSVGKGGLVTGRQVARLLRVTYKTVVELAKSRRLKADEVLATRYKTQIAILERDEKHRPLNLSET
jgi:hypothetical protein